MARPKATQLSLLSDIEAMDAERNPPIGYPPLVTAMCTMPGKRPPDDLRVWTRENGRLTFTVAAGVNPDGTSAGLPYGPKARLLLAHLGGYAVKYRTPVIDLGASMSGFMGSLRLANSGGPYGPRTLVGEQVVRLVRSSMEILWDTGDSGHDKGAGMRFARSWNVWWDREVNSSHPLQGSFIELSGDFYREIINHSFPLNLDALRILDDSALAMDLYAWLTFRLFSLEETILVPWAALAQQFGRRNLPASGRPRTRIISETKCNILEQLPKVLAVYHRARVTVTDEGLRLQKSPPHVPERGMHGVARAQAAATLPRRRRAVQPQLPG